MPVRLIPQTPSAYDFPLLIKNILRTPLIYYPDREILYRDKMKYTYVDLNRRVQQLANLLSSMGVNPGDTVAMMDWDSHRYLECFFAVPMMGAVLHTINIRLSPDQLIYTINHAKDDVILVNADFLPLLESVKDQMETVKKIILINDGDTDPQTPLSLIGEYEALLAEASPSYDFPDFDENAMATTFYTTGTTGLPKGVYFSHRQIVLHTYGFMSGACAYESQARISSADVYMPMTPMFHVHAWGMPYLCTLLGTRQVYPGKYEPAVLLRLIDTEKVTFSHCVPTIIHMLINSPEIDQVDLSRWKVIIGGSALSQGLCQAALQRGINIYSAYGMSETCPLLTIANLKSHMADWDIDRQVEIRCRTGLPVPNVLLEVVDPEGTPVPHDGKSVGEVVVRAPWLTQGYVDDAEKSEALWERGWLHTGDIGFIDAEGYLQITDRIKDVIKTGGEWISSLELESVISRHPAVSEAAVIGVPDPKWVERPLALVVLKPGLQTAVSPEELKAFFAQHADEGVIPRYGVPDRVEIVESIAKTSVGKINKKQLRVEYK
ncbi:Long-chain-fatty-acid--CoA ligase [Desulfosarcina cetonica]|uniref:fatty acid--CoA ligase n=1 Tax=Desulfosarcina cetonica TaxID=90730 RepID=UPI0006CF27B1|nr:fatty acid--CoA ligase [Desulfosarcina cetonica]VTR66745.1 Long-chain-fatty-acid--CoA ligase [Desulfosarcina cetonica]